MARRIQAWAVKSGLAEDYSEDIEVFESRKDAEAYALELLNQRDYGVDDDEDVDDALNEFSGGSSDGEQISIVETAFNFKR